VPGNGVLSEADPGRGVFRDEVALLTPLVARDPTAKHPVRRVKTQQSLTAYPPDLV
jgi:hypothetical protein